MLQTYSGDVERVIKYLGDVQPEQINKLKAKAVCAWNWVKTFAPEDFRFSLKDESDALLNVTETEGKALKLLSEKVELHMDSLSEKEFSTHLYDVARELEIESGDFFPVVYKALIGKEKGPRLLSFLYIIGREKLVSLLGKY